jgi:TPR repeat protein
VKQSDHNALLYYEAASESGDPFAHFTLGLWYYHGRGGLTADPKKSFTLQSQAADAGHPAAMFNVGTAYLTGDGVDKDYLIAVEWLEKAAKANILEARFNLAKVYMDGPPGIDRDLQKAKSYVVDIASRHEIAKMLVEEIEERITKATSSS